MEVAFSRHAKGRFSPSLVDLHFALITSTRLYFLRRLTTIASCHDVVVFTRISHVSSCTLHVSSFFFLFPSNSSLNCSLATGWLTSSTCRWVISSYCPLTYVSFPVETVERSMLLLSLDRSVSGINWDASRFHHYSLLCRASHRWLISSIWYSYFIRTKSKLIEQTSFMSRNLSRAQPQSSSIVQSATDVINVTSMLL